MKQPGHDTEQPSGSLASDLRREFDSAFSRPVQGRDEVLVRLAVVEVGGRRVAVRLEELAAIQTLSLIEALPGDEPHRLGICGIGGRLVPIFDLAGLLDWPKASTPPRIALLCGRSEPLGFACHQLVAQLLVPASRIRVLAQGDRDGLSTDAIVDTGQGELPVLRLSRITDRVRPKGARTKER